MTWKMRPKKALLKRQQRKKIERPGHVVAQPEQRAGRERWIRDGVLVKHGRALGQSKAVLRDPGQGGPIVERGQGRDGCQHRRARRLVMPARAPHRRDDAGGEDGVFARTLAKLDLPVLARAVGAGTPHVNVEFSPRDRRAEIDRDGERIAGAVRMLEHGAQRRRRRCAAERADEGPAGVVGMAATNRLARCARERGRFIERMHQTGRSRSGPASARSRSLRSSIYSCRKRVAMMRRPSQRRGGAGDNVAAPSQCSRECRCRPARALRRIAGAARSCIAARLG